VKSPERIEEGAGWGKKNEILRTLNSLQTRTKVPRGSQREVVKRGNCRQIRKKKKEMLVMKSEKSEPVLGGGLERCQYPSPQAVEAEARTRTDSKV